MILEAKVIQVLPVTTGDKKDGGKWSNQLIVVETFGQYPKTVCLKLPEKLCNQFTVGQVRKFHYELSSREWNGKYFTDVNVWKFEGSEVVSPGTVVNIPVDTAPATTPVSEPVDNDSSGLPF